MSTHRTIDDPAGPESWGLTRPPNWIPVGDGDAPGAPVDVRDTGSDPSALSDLALRAAYTVPQFNTEWVARRIHLPQVLVGEILEQLRTDKLLDILGQAGPFGFRYSISQRGRERAERLLEVSGYVG